MKGTKKHVKRVVSLLLTIVMMLSLIPGTALAAMEADEWKVQRFGDNVVQAIPEGILTPLEDSGSGFLFDYRRLRDEMGYGSIIVYNDALESYADSIWTFDLMVTGEDNNRYRIGMFPRFVDGRNCDGIAIDTPSAIQHSYQVNGSEGWPGISNEAGIAFECDKTYAMKVVTSGNKITLYVDGVKAAQTDTRSEITKGKPAIRIWGPVDGTDKKKVQVSNMEFGELKNSSVNAQELNIIEEDWGEKDIEIPITLADGDRVESVRNSDKTLMEGTDYTVEEGKVILKKGYIANQEGSFLLEITFAGKMSGSCTIVKLVEEEQQEYVWTPQDGMDMWKKFTGSGTAVMEEAGLRLKGENKLFALTSPVMKDGEIEVTFDYNNDNGKFGMLFRGNEKQNIWQNVLQTDGDGIKAASFNFRNSNGTNKTIHKDGTFLFDRKGFADTKLKVRFQGKTISMWLDDYYMCSATVSEAAAAEGRIGLSTESSADVLVKKVVCRTLPYQIAEEENETANSITKDGLIVSLAEDFPRVIDYTLNDKKLYGSDFVHNYVTINTVDYPASAVIISKTEEKVVYAVTVEEPGVTFDVEYTVLEGNILDMRIKNIDDSKTRVNSVGFPNQPLLAATNQQTGAKLDTVVPNPGQYNIDDAVEKHYVIADGAISFEADTPCIIPVITTDELSASMANNVIANMREFRYRAYKKTDGTTLAGFSNQDFMYRGLDGERILEDEDLYCQVVLTEDTNADGQMDWQDGANALKTIIKGKINGGDKMADSFIHVGYNFASGAQQPFLKAADNTKRLSNYLDGFDQILVFKGYANEGHDSGHSDYDDINKRAGGAEDMQKAAEVMQDINATMGIHINHSECYPEAKMYSDETMSTHNGWAWMDQSKILRRDVDILNGGMDSRLNSMFDKVPGIGFVYVDTYGDDRWPSARLAKNLTKDHGAMMGTENKTDFDRYAAWVHWPGIGDGMHRFVYHTQKDVYNGSNLYWGGYSRSASMMSWQHNNNINSLVSQFYKEQLPQKYLMNHDVRKQTATEAVFEGNVRTTNDKKIYKDGNLIADGSNLIFIPWFAEDSQTRNPDEAAKIYHWNENGGKSTWVLPAEWTDLQNVYLYETTQNGKKLIDTIAVEDGKVTIDAKARTPYVVYKGEAKPDETVWSEGSPLKDTGFNSRDFSVWEKAGDADIQFNDDGNGVSILTMTGEKSGQVSQTMEGLKPGQKYRVLTYAGSENGKTARLIVETPDGETYENYVDQIGMSNQYFDNYAKGKRVQLMWVDFVQPEGETTAKVTLLADACDSANGKVTFMENRIVKTKEPELPANYVANETFEYVEQGAYGIFSPERSADGVPHLSETHLPYTSDTISGDWSLKLYGHYGQGDVTVRTSPATARMQPNTMYKMEFDTQGSGKVYVQSESDGNDKILNEGFEAGHSSFTFTTKDKKDYIVRIERGRVLDNFVIYSLEDDTAPSVPQGLSVTEEDGSLRLTWNESIDEDTWVIGYNVYRDGILIKTVDKTEYVDKDLAENTTYQYQVSALNVANTESEKSVAVEGHSGPDLKAPGFVSAQMKGMDEVTLVFDELLDEETANTATNYVLSGGGKVSEARLLEDGKTVVLKVSEISADKLFLLTITGVKDISAAKNACDGIQTQLSLMARYFKFDEANTKSAYDTIGQEDGKKINVGADASGISGNAADFTKDSIIELSGDVMMDAPEWTFSAWINWDGNPTESETILGNDVSGSPVAGMWFHVRKDHKLWASPYDGSRGVDLTSSQTVPTGKWTHVAITFKNKEFIMYFDGEETARKTFPTYPDSLNNPVYIGAHCNGSGSRLHKFGGSMDEAKFYRIALNAEQIKNQAENTKFVPEVVGDTFIVDKTTDLNIKVSANGYTLSGISTDGDVLVKEAYTFNENALTLYQTYLDTLSAGEHAMEFTFEKAEEESVTIQVKMIVKGEVSIADKSDLEELIVYAKTQQTNPKYQYLIPAVKTLFEKALADAETVWKKPNAAQTEVDAAYDALLAKVHLLDFTGNTESLKVLIDAADGKQEEMYTKESWAPFARAFDAAKELLKNENALQAEIDATRDALKAAMEALVLKPIDTKKLEKLIADSKQYEDRIDKYTSDSAKAFTAALEGARGILAGDKLTQEAVDSAYTTLRNAIFGLREIPDKDKLEELLGKVKAMDLSVYSEATANAVKAAYAKAMAVFEDENADQKKVDAAAAALEEAVAAAKAEAGTGDVSKEDGTSKKEDDSAKGNKAASDNAGSKGTANKTAAKTGDSANAAIPVTAGLVAILAAVIVWKKKTN